MKKTRLLKLTGFGALAIFAGAFTAVGLIRVTAPAPAEILRSVEVVDRNGVLLRPFSLSDGRWRLAAKPEQVDRRSGHSRARPLDQLSHRLRGRRRRRRAPGPSRDH